MLFFSCFCVAADTSYEDFRTSLQEAPDNLRLIRKAKALAPELKDAEERKALIVLHALGCRANGLEDEADEINAYILKFHSGYQGTRFIGPGFTGASCEKCRLAGQLFRKCEKCQGTSECSVCNGSGQMVGKNVENVANGRPCLRCKGTGGCVLCKGTGVLKHKCATCKGDGTVIDKSKVRRVYHALLHGDATGLRRWIPMKLSASNVVLEAHREILWNLRDELAAAWDPSDAKASRGVLKNFRNQQRELVSNKPRGGDEIVARSYQAMLKELQKIDRYLVTAIAEQESFESEVQSKTEKAKRTIRLLKLAAREPGNSIEAELLALKKIEGEFEQLYLRSIGTRQSADVNRQWYGIRRAVATAEAKQ